MIKAPEVGQRLVCVTADGGGQLRVGGLYHIADKQRVGRTWRIEVEEIPERWFNPDRFTEVKGRA